jgi:transposase-like protein
MAQYSLNPDRCQRATVSGRTIRSDVLQLSGRLNAKQGFREFQAARRTIQGYEAIHMIRKGQVRWVAGDDLLRQIQLIDSLFDLAA